MNPDNQTIPTNPQDKDDIPLGGLQPGEELICEIRRHPVGLFGVYGVTALLVVIALAAAVLAPSLLQDLSSQAKLGIVLGGLVVAFASLLIAYIGTSVYNANRWVITNGSITQFTQSGLFDKQESQLSLANLEDVTYERDGLLQSLLGFGTLRVETAGEHSKFTFPYCPDPQGNARKIIAAHESYIAKRPEDTLTANRPLVATDHLNPPAA